MWLTQVPTVIIKAYTQRMPPLEAEESLRESERFAVGMGNRSQSFTRQAIERWTRQSGAPTPKAIKAKPADLRRLGFGYRRVVVPVKEATT